MWIVVVLAVAAAFVAALLFLMVRFIPNDRIAVVEKRFSARGSVEKGLIALAGEAGFQPHVLRGGIHYLNRFQYRLHILPLVTIAQGKVGYVFARDGHLLAPTQTLAHGSSETADLQDVRAFLDGGGQRGPQRRILREGTYAINLVQFVVLTDEQIYHLPLAHDDARSFRGMADVIAERDGFTPVVIRGADDLEGIVTVHDGPSLAAGEIIAPIRGNDPEDAGTYHNGFQDPEKFIAAGGLRGRQMQVLVDGTYYINRLFATVEMIPKTVVEVGTVGVVVSYIGDAGADLSGAEYKHGEMVAPGQKGVWSEPLLPGKYAFNTYAGRVVAVPTTNFILKWNRAEMGSHRYDESLAEVSLITKDAFEPSLPLSVVVHIDYRKAPLVIQRFGDVKRLVEQTLDPMVSAYFKNIGQTRTLIQLLQDRSVIQQIASQEMKEKFAHYNLELEEVLIGTPRSSGADKHIDEILQQLRVRQIAEEQVVTYGRQQKAAVHERELREAEAHAQQQTLLTESELAITVRSNQGRAEAAHAMQKAEQIRYLAQAEADRVRAMAEAEADRTARVGVAQAIAIEEQVRAYGGAQNQLTQQVMGRFAEAIEKAGVDVVPRILISGESGKDGRGGGNFMEALMAMLLAERTGEPLVRDDGPRRPEAEALRSAIRGRARPGRDDEVAAGGAREDVARPSSEASEE